MKNKVVLISDDLDFFEYIVPKLLLRKSDELCKFSYTEFPEKLSSLFNFILVINSENHHQETLELLDFIENIPVIIFEYNEDTDFKIQLYQRGIFSYITLNTSGIEISAKIVSALKFLSTVNKNSTYRELLVKNSLITKNNEVYLDYTHVLDNEINNIKTESSVGTLVAISPDDKSKFIIQPNQIETIILNNVRNNDILMNYAPNKYFLLLHHINKENAFIIWKNLLCKLPKGLYAGFSQINNKCRQQVINEALHNLQESINNRNNEENSSNIYTGVNFKLYRQEFNKKIEQIILPVFYHIQQTYNDKLFGMKLEQDKGDGFGVLSIKSKHYTGVLKITSPGFAKINVDITIEHTVNEEDYSKQITIDSKRINLDPDEFEEGFLQDLLEQFIFEFKNIVEKSIQ